MECIINKVNPEFNRNWTFQYRLSILFRQDGFSFVISHDESSKIWAIADYRYSEGNDANRYKPSGLDDISELSQEINSIDLLSLTYSSCEIAFSTERFMVAPESYAHKSYVHILMSVIHKPLPQEAFISETIFENGPACVTLVSKNVLDFVKTKWPGAKIRCASSVFVKSIMRQYSQLLKRQIFVQVWNGYFEIAVIQGMRLLYLNAFKYATILDIQYYLIFVLEQLGFTTSEEDIIIVGDSINGIELIAQLKMYFGGVQFGSDNSLAFADMFQSHEIQSYKYFTLINMPLCG